MRDQQRAESPYASFTPLELLTNNIETQRHEAIPLDRVLTENAIVDDAHARDLGKNMREGRGQLIPIAARARLEEGEIYYDIIDGFHRTEGKKINGDTDINATVVYGCSDEELFDLRILAASSVRSVQFPRIAQWITNSYSTTEWSQKGLSVSQAFGLAVNDSGRSYIARELQTDDIKEIKEWAKAKCERWGKTLSSTYSILKTVENADPDLVQQVRNSGGGKDRAGKITPGRLQAVVNAFPGEDYFPAQRALLDFVKQRRLSEAETKQIVGLCESHILPGMGESEVQRYLVSLKFQVQVFPETDNDEYEAVPWEDEEPTFFDISGSERNSPSSDNLNGNGKEPTARRRSITRKLSNPGTAEPITAATVEALQQRVRDLEAALDLATASEGTAGSTQVAEWWKTASYLTANERVIMENLFGNNVDLDHLAAAARIPTHRVISYVQSSFAKRRELLKKNSYRKELGIS